MGEASVDAFDVVLVELVEKLDGTCLRRREREEGRLREEGLEPGRTVEQT